MEAWGEEDRKNISPFLLRTIGLGEIIFLNYLFILRDRASQGGEEREGENPR